MVRHLFHLCHIKELKTSGENSSTYTQKLASSNVLSPSNPNDTKVNWLGVPQTEVLVGNIKAVTEAVDFRTPQVFLNLVVIMQYICGNLQQKYLNISAAICSICNYIPDMYGTFLLSQLLKQIV